MLFRSLSTLDVGAEILGDFDPAVVKTKEFELAHHFHEKGYVDKEGPHYHKIAAFKVMASKSSTAQNRNK